MDSFRCESVNLTRLALSVDSVNYSNTLPWLISRLRPFLYLSDPREESFEAFDQVPDYHTEVSLLFKFQIAECN